ncbi:hypothetical protein Dimus_007192 [Dionaea muscipula]
MFRWGDMEYKKKKSVSDLKRYDPKGPEDVHKIAEDSSVFVLPFDFLSSGALSGLVVVVVLVIRMVLGEGANAVLALCSRFLCSMHM